MKYTWSDPERLCRSRMDDNFERLADLANKLKALDDHTITKLYEHVDEMQQEIEQLRDELVQLLKHKAVDVGGGI